MEGEKETMQLRIDVSLDQDKDENQDQEIVYSQSAENSHVDVVTLESDCPSSSNSTSSSSSSDDTMSGPKHVEIISLNTPPNVFKSASKRFTNFHSQRDATISSIISTHQSQTESIPTS